MYQAVCILLPCFFDNIYIYICVNTVVYTDTLMIDVCIHTWLGQWRWSRIADGTKNGV